MSLAVAIMGMTTVGPTEPAQAQLHSTTQQGVNGYNVTRADFGGGSFRQTDNGRWTEYDSNGAASFSFEETGRDEWSVYLDDRSRNVQIQLDLHRKWISYGQNGGGKSDLYRISSSSRQQASSPAPRPLPRPRPRPSNNKRDIKAGPIWNQQDAETKCPVVAASHGGQWTGQWRTTVQGRMSVCEIRF